MGATIKHKNYKTKYASLNVLPTFRLRQVVVNRTTRHGTLFSYKVPSARLRALSCTFRKTISFYTSAQKLKKNCGSVLNANYRQIFSVAGYFIKVSS